MKISKVGIDLIKKWESFRAKAYLDSVGIPTIGWGTIKIDGKPVTLGMTCTEAEAEKWLIEHIESEVEPAINRLVKVDLTQSAYDSLCSFVYNLGAGSLTISTLLKKLNSKDIAGASKEFIRWNKGKVDGKMVVINGLTNRRKDEQVLFNSIA